MFGVLALIRKKACDRVEYHALISALRHFNIEEGYIVLIHMMYNYQVGTMNGKNFFDISRGVR